MLKSDVLGVSKAYFKSNFIIKINSYKLIYSYSELYFLEEKN